MENSTRCPKCGFVSSSYFAVCPNCGFSFAAPPQEPPSQIPYQQPQSPMQYTYDQFKPQKRKSKTALIIGIVIAFVVIAMGIGTYIAVKMLIPSTQKTTTEESYTRDSKSISDSSMRARKSTSEKETIRMDNKTKDEQEALKRKELNKNKIKRSR